MKFKLAETLNEKWYKDCSAPVWWSDSEYEFRNFIKNLAATQKSQGYRLVIGPDTYAVANAMDLNHDMIHEKLDDVLFVAQGNEAYTLGIPTMRDFDMNNYELAKTAWEDYQAFCDDPEDVYNSEIILNWINDGTTAIDIPTNMNKTEFIKFQDEHTKSYYPWHTAYFNGFEVAAPQQTEAEFKQTELYRVLAPLYKGFE